MRKKSNANFWHYPTLDLQKIDKMKSTNYNQLRQTTFEKAQTLDLTHFQQNKNFYYELNDFEIPFDLDQNSSELENHFKKIKNKSIIHIIEIMRQTTL